MVETRNCKIIKTDGWSISEVEITDNIEVSGLPRNYTLKVGDIVKTRFPWSAMKENAEWRLFKIIEFRKDYDVLLAVTHFVTNSGVVGGLYMFHGQHLEVRHYYPLEEN